MKKRKTPRRWGDLIPPALKRNLRRLKSRERSRKGMNAKTDQSQDWRTPRWIVDLIERIAGRPIDLDPCTDAENPVGARVFFTEADDGLRQPWGDLDPTVRLVYVNPPYKQAAAWLAKIRSETEKRPELLVFFLCPAFTDQPWYGDAVYRANDEISVKGRVRFLRPSGRKATSPHFPSTIFSFGDYGNPAGVAFRVVRRGIVSAPKALDRKTPKG